MFIEKKKGIVLISIVCVVFASVYVLAKKRPPRALIPILLYHDINTKESRYSVTPHNFRAHLEKLWQAGFVTARLEDVLTNKEHIRNKKIVLLRFDDSRRSQCNYLIKENGTSYLDPDCAAGILLEFYKTHPSFGKHALFCIIPLECFGQRKYCKDKCLFLLKEGMELVNHGFYHVDLTQATPDEIDANFGKAMNFWHSLLGPDRADTIISVATPYGTQPSNNEARQRLHCFSYQGKTYHQKAVLYAGKKFNKTAHTPLCPHFDPYCLPALEVTNSNFDRILSRISY
ncbi:hypothetical protein H0X06_02170 [Candidatus Dependentiae bacterium]|nr:hypothetical protein [Candidatus Dependentiae bacterium]